MKLVFAVLIAAALGMPATAAPPTFDSDVIEPTLEQCIVAATTQGSSEGGPIITDCVSLGSHACQAQQTSPSSSVILKCDAQELMFWEALIKFEMVQLQTSLKPPGQAALKASEKAWIAWKDARCDLVRKSGKNAALTAVDVSFCLMETTALRAIDLMAAL